MGMFPDLLPGGKPNVNESLEKLKKVWGVNNLSNRINENLFDLLGARDVKNVFVFGEDPVGCTMDPKSITLYYPMQFCSGTGLFYYRYCTAC